MYVFSKCLYIRKYKLFSLQSWLEVVPSFSLKDTLNIFKCNLVTFKILLLDVFTHNNIIFGLRKLMSYEKTWTFGTFWFYHNIRSSIFTRRTLGPIIFDGPLNEEMKKLLTSNIKFTIEPTRKLKILIGSWNTLHSFCTFYFISTLCNWSSETCAGLLAVKLAYRGIFWPLWHLH